MCNHSLLSKQYYSRMLYVSRVQSHRQPCIYRHSVRVRAVGESIVGGENRDETARTENLFTPIMPSMAIGSTMIFTLKNLRWDSRWYRAKPGDIAILCTFLPVADRSATCGYGIHAETRF